MVLSHTHLRRCLRAASIAALFAAFLPGNAGARESLTLSPAPWVSFGVHGTFVERGDDLASGSMTVFAPLFSTGRSLGFLQAEGELASEDIRHGRLAAGLRYFDPVYGVAGIWAGYAGFRDSGANGVSAWTGGIEWLTPHFEMRGQWQVAQDGVATGRSAAEVSWGADRLEVTGLVDVPLSGGELEVGLRLPVDRILSQLDNHELRIFAGAFHYDDDDAHAPLEGGRIRTEWRINDVGGWAGSRLTFESVYERSKLAGDDYRVGARLRLPLDASARQSADPNAGQAHRMTERIASTRIRFSGSKAEGVIDNRTGVALVRRVDVVDGGVLQDAVDAGPNTLIVANGQFNENVVLSDNQTLVGGGGALQLRGARTGALYNWSAPGPAATITASTGAIVTAANNAHIVAMTLDGQQSSFVPGNFGIDVGSGNLVVAEQGRIQALGDAAIFGGDTNDVSIEGQVITDVARSGINLGSQNTIRVIDSGFTNVLRHGAFLGNNNTVAISGSSFTNIGGKGLIFGNANDLTVVQSSFVSLFGDGIDGDANNSIRLDETLISDVGDRGIQLGNGNTVLANNLVVRNAGASGVRLGDDNTFVSNQLNIETAGGVGIEVFNNNNVTLDASAIRGTGDSGVSAEFGNSIVVRGSVIDGTGNDGVDAFDSNQVTVENTQIRNVADDAVVALNNSSLAISGSVFADVGQDGVLLGDGTAGSITDSVMTNLGRDGISAGSNNAVTVTNVTINGAGDDGIQLDQDNALTVVASSIVGVGDNGITTGSGTGNTISVADTAISNASNGVRLYNSNTLSIENSTISDITLRGIDAEDNNTISVAGAAFSTVGEDGIEVRNGGTLSVTGVTFTDIRDDVIDLNANVVASLNQMIVNGTSESVLDVDSSGNSIDLNELTIAGTVSQPAISVAQPGNILNGTSNVIGGGASLLAGVCEGSGNFSGTLEIAGFVIVDGGAPCS